MTFEMKWRAFLVKVKYLIKKKGKKKSWKIY